MSGRRRLRSGWQLRTLEAGSRRCQKPWGIFNVLNVGALLVLLVIAGYTGLFMALMTLRL